MKQSTIIKKSRLLLDNATWALKVVWQTNSRLLVGMAVFMVVRGALPAGLALFARGLVNSLVSLFETGSADLSVVTPWLILGFVLTLGEAIMPIVHKYSLSRLSDDVNIRVTGDILEHAAGLDLAFFEDPDSQRMIERARQNTANRFTVFIQELFRLATGLLQVISLTGVLAYIEPLVLLILGPIALPYLWHRWRIARKRYTVEFERTQKRRWSGYFVSQMTSRSAIPDQKLFNLAPHFIERFRTLLNEFREQDRSIYRRTALGGILFVVMATLAFYVLFFRVVGKAMTGGLTIGDVAVFGTATSRLRSTLEQMIMALTNALEQTLYIANLRDFLEAEPLMVLPPGSGGDVPGRPENGAIRLESVEFTYPGAETPTLHDVSFEIEPGEIVGIVGENGAGKTTLVKLISRLYDATGGRVLIDGEDVRLYEIGELQKAISFVQQNFSRYEATASDNIAYGKWEELLGDTDRVREIARMTGADELIRSMPDGYDTMLGRIFGTFDLSGGQWQTLAASRAFARDARILVLDEPTAHLDARAEYALFEKFRELAQGRTTLLISHRFSTIRMADRILVLHGGRLIEDGSHEDLMALGGHYADLYGLHRRQFDLD